MSFACASGVDDASVDDTLDMLEPEDKYWVLAYGLIDSLADDLAIYRRLGWWNHSPFEMEGHPGFHSVPANHPHLMPPSALLRELRSETLQLCFEAVAAGSSGRLRLNMGAVVRLAKVDYRNK